MQITVEIPDDMAEQLKQNTGSISREMLEAFAVEGYRTEKLSRGQVSELLGLNFWETEDFLKQRGACLHYDLIDLDQDRHTTQKLVSK
jgi:predicted HTH domain antitoxin